MRAFPSPAHRSVVLIFLVSGAAANLPSPVFAREKRLGTYTTLQLFSLSQSCYGQVSQTGLGSNQHPCVVYRMKTFQELWKTNGSKLILATNASSLTGLTNYMQCFKRSLKIMARYQGQN